MINKTTQANLTHLFIIASLFILFSACQKNIERSIHVIPYPQNVIHKSGNMDISQGFEIVISSFKMEPLLNRLKEDYRLLLHKDLNTSKDSDLPKFWLIIDDNFPNEYYELSIQKSIVIKAGSFQALNYGINTFWQLLQEDQSVPKIKIKDQPDLPFRALMIDCARQWHPIENLKSIIRLAAFYKINYVQLHLTDDQLFTFQSDFYPELATKNRSYSKAELRALNDYAFLHGVILIPEIDIPGHSSQFIRKLPEIFGIDDINQNPYTLSMVKESCYEALDTLFGEVADIFPYSPYIHMGGDEGHFAGMENDLSTIKYMEQNDIPSVDELFRHFIIRINEIIKSKEKKTMAWAGFSREGEIEIPKDILIVSWESQYYDPNHLSSDGFDFINASWKPMYIVNPRKWTPEYIYNTWNPRRWESSANKDSTFTGIEIENTPQLKGGMMCSWEQASIVELKRLEKRLPVMSEKLWQTTASGFHFFQERFEQTSIKAKALISPISVVKNGLIDYGNPEGNFLDHLRFKDSLLISMFTKNPNYSIKYTLNDSLNQDIQTYSSPIIIKNNTWITAQVYDEKGNKIGLPFQERYFHFPVEFELSNIETNQLPGSWEKTRFKDSVIVNVKSVEDGKIEFSAKNSAYEPIKLRNPPFTFKQTTHITAQKVDYNGNKIGLANSQSLHLVKEEVCLTTNKPIISYDDEKHKSSVKKVNNGRSTLWEHWGDLNNGNNWLKIDLEEPTDIEKLKVVFFWDNNRYYQYIIEGSTDNESWKTLVDGSTNTEIETIDGHVHEINKIQVRYLKLKILKNSANPGIHVTEFCAY